jgi:hypothetical protein
MLRRDDDSRAIVEYMLENPVRAGLVTLAAEYPFAWTSIRDSRARDFSPAAKTTTTSRTRN